MLGGNRLYVFAAIGFLSLAGISGLAVQQIDQRSRREPAAEIEITQPAKKSGSLGRIADAVEGIANDSQTETEREYQTRDLYAQEEAARWARWAFWAALLQLLLSGGGIYLISETLKATRSAVKEAGSATDVAQKALAITEDTARRELRAYVMAEDHEAIDFQPGHPWAFRFKIHNRGQTPAYDVRLISRIRATTDETPEAFRMRFGKPEVAGSKTVIGPGQWVLHENPAKEVLTHETWDFVHNEVMTIIFSGVVSYSDIFNRRRLTTFKYYLRTRGKRDGLNYDLTACAVGNKSN